MKNQPRGFENQRKPEAGRVLGALGAVLGIFGALWWELLAKLGQIGRKMIEVGARTASSRVLMGHGGAKRGHDFWGSSGRILEGF